MKLSRTVAYAVRATVELAQAASDQPIPRRELARRGELPDRFLVQILHSLVSHGILHSVVGSSGGFLLARAPDLISVLDIVESFEDANNCTLPNLRGLSIDSRQKILDTLISIHEFARCELKKLTIADLASCR